MSCSSSASGDSDSDSESVASSEGSPEDAEAPDGNASKPVIKKQKRLLDFFKIEKKRGRPKKAGDRKRQSRSEADFQANQRQVRCFWHPVIHPRQLATKMALPQKQRKEGLTGLPVAR